ncbi:hypothetical protein BC567DRAFT_180864 [Phyllosticta citribraziliensis]
MFPSDLSAFNGHFLGDRHERRPACLLFLSSLVLFSSSVSTFLGLCYFPFVLSHPVTLLLPAANMALFSSVSFPTAFFPFSLYHAHIGRFDGIWD